ncbi:expressed protein [Phakopsora pachyrhizi]|uniref:Expressed protein n=1 Tax=Phakopsora pachyrhizi TaxID=170000 RepID=A0AAV0B8A4_PHAPC|nr:expressed protein [Phakopsora pachyrhizi]
MRFKKCSDRHRLIRRKSQWAIVRDSPLLPIDNAITPTEMTKVGVGSSKPVRSDDIRMDGLVRMVLSVDRPRRMDGIIREDSRNGKIPGLKCLMILSISRVLKSKSNENYGQDEMERGLEEYQRPVDRRGTSPNDKTAAIPLAKNLAPTSQQNDLSKKLTSSDQNILVSLPISAHLL